MGKITKLPAYNCIFFRSGHCIHEEAMNPGLDPEKQCHVLMELENRYDHLLTQADIFDLTSEQVQRIWAGRFGEIVSWEMFCDIYVPESAEDDRCHRLFGSACTNRFSRCPGICPLYIAKRPQKDIES